MDERELIYDWNRAGGATSFDWTRARVDLNDETLRDGLQSPSVRDPALDVKKRLLHLMADLGIVAADIGLPGAGPRVVEQVRALAMEIRDAKLPVAPNCAARTVIPTSSATRTIGSMSAITVRAAQFGATGSLASRISIASARTCSTTRGPAPGNPMSAATIPRSAMRCSRRFLTSSAGSRTEGDCRPSRSVSSFRSTRARVQSNDVAPPARFQS